jgi:serine/threonine protein kinase
VSAAGDLIGPYRLVGRLGKGAMGEVWRARDERLDRLVAVKLLPADRVADVEHRARMIREARAAAAVPHPNVVTLYDIVSEGERDVLVMELVEGQTLAELLRGSGPPPIEDALAWLEGLADALATAHGKGILHRDVKSANVMVTPARAIKVLDFGLAKLVGQDDGLQTVTRAVRPSVPRSTAERAIAMDETMPSETPGAAATDASLAETMAEAPARTATGSGSGSGDAYVTRAGALLGTPMYMAPEQITGGPPDERTEVFSVGIIAYELFAGKPPYTATTLDELFLQITTRAPPPLADVPVEVTAIVERALAKDPAERFPSMRALRDAVVAARHHLFRRRRVWPIAVAIGAAVVAGGVAVALALRGGGADETPAERPGDRYVDRALEQYNVFNNDAALVSLRSALRIAPTHPRASAYVILFGGAPAVDRTAAAAAADRALVGLPAHGKERALLSAAIALERHGPKAARAALDAVGARADRELRFWSAELAYRGGDYATAAGAFRALLADPAASFRGRIYDHDSAVLLYLDEPAEAATIGALYRDAFPAEADAIGVHATTLAAAGRLDEALVQAELALQLAEGEDTLAGLAKVRALRGERAEAAALYRRSIERAGPSRRPIRRAALAMLQWIDGDVTGARDTVTPCLPGGADATAPERGQCLFVAGALDPTRTEAAAAELDALARAASDIAPAYGAPAQLARLLRVRAVFFGGACVVAASPPVAPVEAAAAAALDEALAGELDFYASYHVPFFATWQVCERAALAAATGDKARAASLLGPVAERAPGRTWLLDDLAAYR